MTHADPTMPWGPPPTGDGAHYQSDGPREPTVVDVDGVRMLVTPTGDVGCNTGRVRYRVVCLTCESQRGLFNAVIHPATTGPRSRIVAHIRLHKENPR